MCAMYLSQNVQKVEGSLTLEITALAAALKAEGKPVIAFAAGEPDIPPPAAVKTAGQKAIEENLGRYTPAAGLPTLRAAAARRFTRAGLPYTKDEVIITAGAKPALYLAFWGLLEPGDEVIIPTPYWTAYPSIVESIGGKSVFVACRPEDGFQLDVEAIKKAITPRTRALLINSPNNPTGAVYTKDRLLKVAALLRGTRIHIVSDDIYDELTYGDEPFQSILHVAPDLKGQTVTINGLSKSHSMTGWRLGYVGAPLDFTEALARAQGQLFGNVCAISQHAGVAALEAGVDPERAKLFDRRRKFLLAKLAEIKGLHTPEPRGAFYAFCSIAPWLGKRYRGQVMDSSATLAKALLAHELVATVPGSAFGAPDHLRITYCLAEDQIGEGISRLKRFLGEMT